MEIQSIRVKFIELNLTKNYELFMMLKIGNNII